MTPGVPPSAVVRPVLLTVNTGSSSLKVSVFGIDHGSPLVAAAEFTALGTAEAAVRWDHEGEQEASAHPDADQGAAFDEVLGEVDRLGWVPEAIGHRIVHGGADHVAPELATPALLEQLEALVPLAPLHQPHNLWPVRRIAERRPDVAQVLSYDTAFHATIPDVARHFALPRSYLAKGVLRYGFHGLSYEHVVSVLPSLMGPASDGRAIVAHLGAGSSLSAIHHGRSVATTMGFSPIDGVPMATRSGALDPGALIYLLRQGLSVDELDELLNRRSGLLGYSGISGDMRTLLGSKAPDAQGAVDLYCYRIREAIGALIADLGGLDALVFTGGIGENSPEIRSRVCDGLEWLGVLLDDQSNNAGSERIDAHDANVVVGVVHADEAAVLARHTRQVVSGSLDRPTTD